MSHDPCHLYAQARQQASSQKELVKALTEQLEKADKLHKERTETLEARVKDLTGAVEEAQVQLNTKHPFPASIGPSHGE